MLAMKTTDSIVNYLDSGNTGPTSLGFQVQRKFRVMARHWHPDKAVAEQRVPYNQWSAVLFFFFWGGFGLINLLQVAYICIPVYAERYLRYYLKEDLISRLFLISVSNKKNTFGICCTRVKVRWCNSQKFCRGIQDPSTWQEVLYPVLSASTPNQLHSISIWGNGNSFFESRTIVVC